MTQVDADAADAAPRISALSPFRYPLFRSVWAASTLSNLGALIQSVGASWMMISDRTVGGHGGASCRHR